MSKINTDLAISKLEKSRLNFSRFPNHEEFFKCRKL